MTVMNIIYSIFQVTFLVHIDEEFVTQFCGCVCSLNVTGVLQLFLKVDGKRPGLAADTVAALCHLLRTFPKDKGIVDAVEEVLLRKLEIIVDFLNQKSFTLQ